MIELYEKFTKLDGSQFRTWRRVLNLSGAQLGDILHVTRQTISIMERDVYEASETLRILAGITLLELSEGNVAASAIADIYLNQERN